MHLTPLPVPIQVIATRLHMTPMEISILFGWTIYQQLEVTGMVIQSCISTYPM